MGVGVNISAAAHQGEDLFPNLLKPAPAVSVEPEIITVYEEPKPAEVIVVKVQEGSKYSNTTTTKTTTKPKSSGSNTSGGSSSSGGSTTTQSPADTTTSSS